MSSEGRRTLAHAVRLGVVLRYVGELGLVLGLAALVPLLGALVLREFALMLPYAGLSALLIGVGIAVRRAPVPRGLQRNEALAVTVVAFLLSPVVMSVPLALQGIPWLDALFEAVSGVTTTGLSTLGTVEGRSQTFLLARAWMQWVGGLGFVVLSLALVLEPVVLARRLEAPGLDPADLAGSLRGHARRLLGVYLVLTCAGLGLLWLLGARAPEAVLYTLAAISTGGFAPEDASLAPLARPLQVGVLAIAVLGAISFGLYRQLAARRWRAVLRDVELRALGVLIAVVAALLILCTRSPGVAAVSGLDLWLLAASAQSTAGFVTLSPSELPPAAKLVVIGSMLVGGSQGSTAGGVKLLRFLVVLRLLHWLVLRTRLPEHAVSSPALAGRRLQDAELLQAAALMLLVGGAVLCAWAVFVWYDYPPLDALFEVASAMGTVGLSVGVVRPELEPALKGLLCVIMLLGRLEVFAMLVALSPGTWIGRRRG